ncbi:MAG: hypothetical protein H6Q52_2994 [Deltaproteobacteria bacterium]|nr:hypothetical protein [Deltaproteobacteria bacterium]
MVKLTLTLKKGTADHSACVQYETSTRSSSASSLADKYISTAPMILPRRVQGFSCRLLLRSLLPAHIHMLHALLSMNAPPYVLFGGSTNISAHRNEWGVHSCAQEKDRQTLCGLKERYQDGGCGERGHQPRLANVLHPRSNIRGDCCDQRERKRRNCVTH